MWERVSGFITNPSLSAEPLNALAMRGFFFIAGLAVILDHTVIKPVLSIQMTQKTNTILIVGVGNTLRGDDGIGAYICSCMELLKIPGVQTLQVQQLDTALLDELMQANHIIIADASFEGKSVEFFKVSGNEPLRGSSSHHMSAPLLLQMAQTIYQKELSLLICAVAGYRFGMKEKLSVKAKKNADIAVAAIIEWINKNN